ncbi:Deleted in malignant brain tumors 1 protein [Mizuhopecten yessoensis]|uniref:Deleted in malignant brain tumors 1 protein n=2 Tax=Mizuhopecten yessoensis TaxID=6573 RepID=A0A210QTI5_MIZYE|nr:Deleted in malignant brain tumors 1 protein [Mizuhopecten yessoensis]
MMILSVWLVAIHIASTACAASHVENPNQVEVIPPGVDSSFEKQKTLRNGHHDYDDGNYENYHWSHVHGGYVQSSGHSNGHEQTGIVHADYSHNGCMLCPKTNGMCVHLIGGQECDIFVNKCYPHLMQRWEHYGNVYYRIDMGATAARSAWVKISTADWSCGDCLQSISTSPYITGIIPGYLAVQHGGVWGHVCAEDWTTHNSYVVCGMMGHFHTHPAHHHHVYHQAHCLMSGINCRGHEHHLSLCPFDGFSSVNCPSGKIIAVDCNPATPAPIRVPTTYVPTTHVPTTPTHPTTTAAAATPVPTTPPKEMLKVRLVNGPSAMEGRVEVLHNGVWGTVCDDSWDDDDAKVVCGMLGYNTATALHASKARYGSGTGPIWLDETQCGGQETNLGQCSMEPYGRGDCDHTEDAGVICQPLTTTSPTTTRAPTEMLKVRLVDGSSAREGRVEVLHNGVWGTVCDDSWDDTDAEVVCRMLGYHTTIAVHTSKARYGSGTGPIWLDETQCGGQETNLGQCSMEPYGRGDCDHTEDAGVMCQQALTTSSQPNVTTTPIRGSWISFG